MQQAEEELALDRTVKPHKHMRVLQFDNKYMIPLLTNLSLPDSPVGRKSFSMDGPEADDAEADGDEVIEVVRRDVQGH